MSVILLVEDNIVALRMVEYILGRAGYDTLGAERADEALEILLDNPVDLAIVDYTLPDMTGVELVRGTRPAQRRQDVELPGLQVVGGEDVPPRPVEVPGQPRDPAEDVQGLDIELGAFRTPGSDQSINLVLHTTHPTCLDVKIYAASS